MEIEAKTTVDINNTEYDNIKHTEHTHTCTTYSMSEDTHTFHVDNLRELTSSDNYEESVAETKINETIIYLTPFLSKCVNDSNKNGPGINFFKFLKNKKIELLKERGIGKVNCEYHYVTETSFYWQNIYNVTDGGDVYNLYDWKKHILIVMAIPNTSIVSEKKYETYAKIIDKSCIISSG